MDRGFILDATYRIERGRPVIHLFGVGDDGETFAVRDTRVRPTFFIESEQVPAAEAVLRTFRGGSQGGYPAFVSDRWQTLAGRPASELAVAIPSDVPQLREALREAGIDCHEADVPFVTRYLIDHRIRGSLRITGTAKRGRRVGRIYEDPLLDPIEFLPALRILSLDLETDPTATRVFSFALYGHNPQGGWVAEVHAVIHAEQRERPENVVAGQEEAPCYYHADEGALLHTLRRRIREIDPDVLTGWNVVGFDLRVLEEAFRRHALRFFLGRADLPCRVRSATDAWMTARATVPGRAVLDGLDLVRSAFVRLDDYSLDTAARTLLGEGKVIIGEGKMITGENRASEIERLYREDLPRFLLYNLTDARLVVEIIEQLDLVALAARRSLLTGLPIDRTAASIAAFDLLYITALHERGIVAPSVEMLPDRRSEPAGASPPAIGGYVLDSVPGIHEHVWLFDYRSLYPSIILTFNIDPLGYASVKQSVEASADVTAEPPADVAAKPPDEPLPDREFIEAPNGARFPREAGILPGIVGRLLPAREEAKRAGDAVGATAIKILMNSLYGVLATPRCRLHSTAVSNAITTFGQRMLRWTRTHLEEMGYRVIYGDTDSVFAVSDLGGEDDVPARGREVVARLNEMLTAWIMEHYGVASHLHLEFERHFVKFFIPSHRGGREGSKKRHAGLIETAAGRELVVTGLESVRRDWTVLAKDFQRHLLRKVLEEEPVEAFVAGFVRELREGHRDQDLVYRKALRKPLDAYEKTSPPHVKAARLMGGRHGRVVSYVMTQAGPQPLGFVNAPLDYDHYLEKQVRPIAESILSHVGIDFDELIGKGGQLGLL
ncbi:MAG: DNA polymerase II [Candidatus Eisenbacteria sp.]|nr:DNA polymerase II [Candidatus Eisenbacteria bacterium]